MKNTSSRAALLKIYWLAASVTLLIWLGAALWGGFTALFTVIVLTFLETTFSADNAVVNSKVLASMSPRWQKLFMTLGIFIAVFLVRFLVPILIVVLTAGLGSTEVIQLAINEPHRYEQELAKAEPIISAFGGTFLLMIALSYFVDYEKQSHWLKFLERRLGKLGRFDDLTIFVMLLAALGLFFTVERAYHTAVLIASIAAMVLHIGLNLLEALFEKNKKGLFSIKPKVGGAALAAFLYLEILDASFSFDGVIGAFAITGSVVLIMAGLGAGAVWVRAMTIHLVRAKALTKYVFLEHGAHWALVFLGLVMLLKLYHIEFPEWFVGLAGIVVIAFSIVWSRRWQSK
ncbi:protein of unknown function DUF475 [candidate division TM7 genomosp. GTL1]|nr:protein of unknown function DUF475 [candidate division TM7 genomosp. GTL1]